MSIISQGLFTWNHPFFCLPKVQLDILYGNKECMKAVNKTLVRKNVQQLTNSNSIDSTLFPSSVNQI